MVGALENEDYNSAIAFKKSWFESYWKSMARIESSNKSSVRKKATEIRIYNHCRMGENPWKDLFKSNQKL